MKAQRKNVCFSNRTVNDNCYTATVNGLLKANSVNKWHDNTICHTADGRITPYLQQPLTFLQINLCGAIVFIRRFPRVVIPNNVVITERFDWPPERSSEFQIRHQDKTELVLFISTY